MRTFSILQESIVPFMSNLVTQLTEKIIVASKVQRNLLIQNTFYSDYLICIHIFFLCFRIQANLISTIIYLNPCQLQLELLVKQIKWLLAILSKACFPPSKGYYNRMCKVHSLLMCFKTILIIISGYEYSVMIALSPIVEFIPYVFQLLSLLLELHTSTIPEAYLHMLPNLLLPPLWERLANIPPLVRLLQAFIEKGSSQIETERVVNYVLFIPVS